MNIEKEREIENFPEVLRHMTLDLKRLGKSNCQNHRYSESQRLAF